VSQRRGVEDGSGTVGQRGRHEVTLAVRVTKARRAKSPDRCEKAIEKPNAGSAAVSVLDSGTR
jgi:hypothetical protein